MNNRNKPPIEHKTVPFFGNGQVERKKTPVADRPANSLFGNQTNDNFFSRNRTDHSVSPVNNLFGNNANSNQQQKLNQATNHFFDSISQNNVSNSQTSSETNLTKSNNSKYMEANDAFFAALGGTSANKSQSNLSAKNNAKNFFSNATPESASKKNESMDVKKAQQNTNFNDFGEQSNTMLQHQNVDEGNVNSSHNRQYDQHNAPALNNQYGSRVAYPNQQSGSSKFFDNTNVTQQQLGTDTFTYDSNISHESGTKTSIFNNTIVSPVGNSEADFQQPAGFANVINNDTNGWDTLSLPTSEYDHFAEPGMKGNHKSNAHVTHKQMDDIDNGLHRSQPEVVTEVLQEEVTYTSSLDYGSNSFLQNSTEILSQKTVITNAASPDILNNAQNYLTEVKPEEKNSKNFNQEFVDIDPNQKVFENINAKDDMSEKMHPKAMNQDADDLDILVKMSQDSNLKNTSLLNDHFSKQTHNETNRNNSIFENTVDKEFSNSTEPKLNNSFPSPTKDTVLTSNKSNFSENLDIKTSPSEMYLNGKEINSLENKLIFPSVYQNAAVTSSLKGGLSTPSANTVSSASSTFPPNTTTNANNPATSKKYHSKHPENKPPSDAAKFFNNQSSKPNAFDSFNRPIPDVFNIGNGFAQFSQGGPHNDAGKSNTDGKKDLYSNANTFSNPLANNLNTGNAFDFENMHTKKDNNQFANNSISNTQNFASQQNAFQQSNNQSATSNYMQNSFNSNNPVSFENAPVGNQVTENFQDPNRNVYNQNIETKEQVVNNYDHSFDNASIHNSGYQSENTNGYVNDTFQFNADNANQIQYNSAFGASVTENKGNFPPSTIYPQCQGYGQANYTANVLKSQTDIIDQQRVQDVNEMMHSADSNQGYNSVNYGTPQHTGDKAFSISNSVQQTYSTQPFSNQIQDHTLSYQPMGNDTTETTPGSVVNQHTYSDATYSNQETNFGVSHSADSATMSTTHVYGEAIANNYSATLNSTVVQEDKNLNSASSAPPYDLNYHHPQPTAYNIKSSNSYQTLSSISRPSSTGPVNKSRKSSLPLGNPPPALLEVSRPPSVSGLSNSNSNVDLHLQSHTPPLPYHQASLKRLPPSLGQSGSNTPSPYTSRKQKELQMRANNRSYSADAAQQGSVLPQPFSPPTEAPVAHEGFYDPLLRHRGHAVATWGLGKLVVTGPKRQNRFMMGANGQQSLVEKAYNGPITIYTVKDVLQPEFLEAVSSFPGPLAGGKTKTKKKDVIKIIEDKIQNLEIILKDLNLRPQENDQLKKNLIENESILLKWKLLKFFCENDGILFTGKSDPAIFQVISESVLSDRSKIATGSAAEEIEKFLIKADRVGACKFATQAELWSHAFILGGNDVNTFREVMLKFTSSSEMNSNQTAHSSKGGLCGDLTSLKVFYNVIGGSGPASLNDFLPINGNFTCSADIIRKWKEILIMVLSNRLPGDLSFCSVLGDRLHDYGYFYSSQICYLLASATPLLGAEVPNSKMILLGSNPNTDLANCINAIQETEIFEFSQTLAGGLASGLPHFQAYKLSYAHLLADIGCMELAQQYCESIDTFVKSYSKGSPYFHRRFLESLRVLIERVGMYQLTKGQIAEAKEKGGSWWISALDDMTTKLMNGVVGLEGEAQIKKAPTPQPATVSSSGVLNYFSSTKLEEVENRPLSTPLVLDPSVSFTAPSVAKTASMNSMYSYGYNPGSSQTIHQSRNKNNISSNSSYPSVQDTQTYGISNETQKSNLSNVLSQDYTNYDNSANVYSENMPQGQKYANFDNSANAYGDNMMQVQEYTNFDNSTDVYAENVFQGQHSQWTHHGAPQNGLYQTNTFENINGSTRVHPDTSYANQSSFSDNQHPFIASTNVENSVIANEYSHGYQNDLTTYTNNLSNYQQQSNTHVSTSQSIAHTKPPSPSPSITNQSRTDYQSNTSMQNDKSQNYHPASFVPSYQSQPPTAHAAFTYQKPPTPTPQTSYINQIPPNGQAVYTNQKPPTPTPNAAYSNQTQQLTNTLDQDFGQGSKSHNTFKHYDTTPASSTFTDPLPQNRGGPIIQNKNFRTGASPVPSSPMQTSANPSLQENFYATFPENNYNTPPGNPLQHNSFSQVKSGQESNSINRASSVPPSPSYNQQKNIGGYKGSSKSSVPPSPHQTSAYPSILNNISTSVPPSPSQSYMPPSVNYTGPNKGYQPATSIPPQQSNFNNGYQNSFSLNNSAPTDSLNVSTFDSTPQDDSLPAVSNQQLENQEEDDFLGLGNKSIGKLKAKTVNSGNSVTPSYPAPEEKSKEKANESDEKDKTSKDGAESGVIKSFWSLFKTVKKNDEPSATQIKQGKPLEARFDEVKKKWIFPGNEDKDEKKDLGAPPIGPIPPSNTPINSSPNSRSASPNPADIAAGTGQQTSYPPVLGKRTGGRKNARSRYVDILNPDATGESSAPAVASFLPTPAFSAGVTEPKIMTPTSSSYNNLTSYTSLGSEHNISNHELSRETEIDNQHLLNPPHSNQSIEQHTSDGRKPSPASRRASPSPQLRNQPSPTMQNGFNDSRPPLPNNPQIFHSQDSNSHHDEKLPFRKSHENLYSNSLASQPTRNLKASPSLPTMPKNLAPRPQAILYNPNGGSVMNKKISPPNSSSNLLRRPIQQNQPQKLSNQQPRAVVVPTDI